MPFGVLYCTRQETAQESNNVTEHLVWTSCERSLNWTKDETFKKAIKGQIIKTAQTSVCCLHTHSAWNNFMPHSVFLTRCYRFTLSVSIYGQGPFIIYIFNLKSGFPSFHVQHSENVINAQP